MTSKQSGKQKRDKTVSNAKYQDRLADYVQVNERISAFYKTWPEGSLQSEIIEHTDKRVVVRAFAYRTPDDMRPGIGHSGMAIPGTTPYTKGSELENAETSAYGRALAALGFEIRRSVATSDEIAGKRGAVTTRETGAEPEITALSTDQMDQVNDILNSRSTPDEVDAADALVVMIKARGYKSRNDFFARTTPEEFAEVMEGVDETAYHLAADRRDMEEALTA